MTILDFPFALLASPLQTFPNSTTDSLVTTSGFKQGGAQCSKAQSFALPNVGLPCLKPLVVSKASIFCHFWRFGEERPRVGGEERRREERKRRGQNRWSDGRSCRWIATDPSTGIVVENPWKFAGWINLPPQKKETQKAIAKWVPPPGLQNQV